MSSARERILAALRAGRGPGDTAPAAEPPPPTPFAGDTEQLIQAFTSRLEAVRAQVQRANAADWTDDLWRLCADKEIGNLLYTPAAPLGPQLDATAPGTPRLVPYAEPVEAWKERLFFATDAAVTSTLGGIAETGSLILWPTPEEPRLMSLVPPVHIAVVQVSALYATFADALRAQRWRDGMPTNALLISGPSKSADIEQTLAYGVHGPKELIVLLVDD